MCDGVGGQLLLPETGMLDRVSVPVKCVLGARRGNHTDGNK